MPALNLDNNSAQYQIRSYQPGQIEINDMHYTHSLIIAATQLITDWPPLSIDELTTESFAVIAEAKPDILLIGTGGTLIFPPVHLYGHLINLGIGVEVMSTSAACRTYNALSAEDRSVYAALIV